MNINTLTLLLVSTALLTNTFFCSAAEEQPFGRRLSLTRSSRVAPAATEVVSSGGASAGAADSTEAKPTDSRRASLDRAGAVRGAMRRSSAAHTAENTEEIYEETIRNPRGKLQKKLDEAETVAHSNAYPAERGTAMDNAVRLAREIREMNKAATTWTDPTPVERATGCPSTFLSRTEDANFYREEGYRYLPRAITRHLVRPSSITHSKHREDGAEIILGGRRYILHRHGTVCYAKIADGHDLLKLENNDTFRPLSTAEALAAAAIQFNDETKVTYWHLFTINEKIAAAYDQMNSNAEDGKLTKLLVPGKAPFKLIVRNHQVYAVQDSQIRAFRAALDGSYDLFGYTFFNIMLHNAGEAIDRCVFLAYKPACCVIS